MRRYTIIMVNMDKRKTPLDDEFIEPHMCDLDLRLYVIKRLPFFHDLPDAAIEEINQSFVERGYAAGEIRGAITLSRPLQ